MSNELPSPDWQALARAWRVGATADDLCDVDHRYAGDPDHWNVACDAATCTSAHSVDWTTYRTRVVAYLATGLTFDTSRNRVMDDLENGV